MNADPDLEHVLRATSIASLRLGGGREKGKEKEKDKEKGKEKGKEKERDTEHAHTNENGQLVHTISPTDTLEGIAVKYGVQVTEHYSLCNAYLRRSVVWVEAGQ